MQAVCRISQDAIHSNYRYFKRQVGGADVIPVVKANAYGHGAVAITRQLHEQEGVTLFAVATLEEARELAAVLPDIRILIFSRVFHTELNQLPEQAIPTVVSREHAVALSRAARIPLKVHLNINTGMNRLGLTPEEALQLIRIPPENLIIDGIYSHFSSSDTVAEETWEKQQSEFRTLVENVRAAGFTGLVHLSNSAGALREMADYYGAIRLGIGLYGYDTTPGADHQANLQPAMEVQAPLIRVAELAAGESVSYGETWQAAVATTIGTLRIGYADGYNRALTNRGQVVYGGKLYPVVGTVTMDHIMVDLGGDKPVLGSMFTVLGDLLPSVQVATVADLLQTIPYEICCAIAPRVTRMYAISH